MRKIYLKKGGFIPYERTIPSASCFKKTFCKNTRDFRTGFTLIEILVVITILLILLGVLATTSIKESKEKAENIKRQIVIEGYRDAINLYRLEHGEFLRPQPEPGEPLINALTPVCIAKTPPGECKNSDGAPGTYFFQSSFVNNTISEWFPVSAPPFKSVGYLFAGKFEYSFEGPIYRCTKVTQGKCVEANFVWILEGETPCGFGIKQSDPYEGVTFCSYEFKL